MKSLALDSTLSDALTVELQTRIATKENELNQQLNAKRNELTQKYLAELKVSTNEYDSRNRKSSVRSLCLMMLCIHR